MNTTKNIIFVFCSEPRCNLLNPTEANDNSVLLRFTMELGSSLQLVTNFRVFFAGCLLSFMTSIQNFRTIRCGGLYRTSPLFTDFPAT